MGSALRRDGENRGGWRAAVARLVALALIALRVPAVAGAQDAPERLDRGRFTAVYFPSERVLAKSLLEYATSTDTFPGLRRPRQRVLLALAPDARRFREWVGPGAPEWGAAITFPESQRIIMQGRSAGSEAGNPREVLRHEVAHLALHEFLGDKPPRWFDEGYASYSAREWNREDVLAANLALAWRGAPSFDELDDEFTAGSSSAQNAYALAYRAVVELAALDTARGLAPFFSAWEKEPTLERAMRATYGITLYDFQKRWQQRTRRRYGALALVGNVTLAGVVALVAILPLYVARRQRDRRRLAALVAADEAAEKAARESAIEALLRGDEEPDFGGEPGKNSPS
jgi:hypothetical protein